MVGESIAAHKVNGRKFVGTNYIIGGIQFTSFDPTVIENQSGGLKWFVNKP